MKLKTYTLSFLTLSLALSSELLQAQEGRFNPVFVNNGLVKERFRENSNAFSEAASSIVNLPDGKSILSIPVNDKLVLTRLNPDGSTDAAFGVNGYSSPVRLPGTTSILAAPDGGYY